MEVYLLITIDISETPTIKRAGLYTSDPGSITTDRKTRYATITNGTFTSFEEGRTAMERYVNEYATWLLPYFPNGEIK